MSTGAFPHLPELVAHADWSLHSRKRWLACARLQDGVYTALEPVNVADARRLLKRLQSEATEGGPVLAGFDFPIGLPLNYANQAGITEFLPWLPQVGGGAWAEFDKVAITPQQISLNRPFFPQQSTSANKMHFLLERLGASTANDLRRKCEQKHAFTQAASPLFWTTGAKQVGKAALSGWRELLIPALRDETAGVVIWPFAGPLLELLAQRRIVVVETYPAEMYHHLGVTWPKLGRDIPSGKQSESARKRNSKVLFGWAESVNVALSPELKVAMNSGFGPQKDGEDPFDAVVGLFGMLNVLLGHRHLTEPVDKSVRLVEGWIFGRHEG